MTTKSRIKQKLVAEATMPVADRCILGGSALVPDPYIGAGRLNMPAVTVVLTTFNRCALLADRSLPSVLRQTYTDFECLVVDDCSTDGTAEVVRSVARQDSRVRLVRHEQNRGLPAARNTGARESRGLYVIYLDDDDAFEPECVAKLVARLAELPATVGAVAAGRLVITDRGTRFAVPRKPVGGLYVSIDDGWLLRREVFDRVAWDEETYHDDDAAFGLMFFQHFSADAVDAPLLLKYAIPDYKGKRYSTYGVPSPRRMKGLDHFVRKYVPIIEAKGSPRERAYINRFVGRTYCIAGSMAAGRPFLRRALRVEPRLVNVCHVAASLLGPRLYRTYWMMETALFQLYTARRSSGATARR
jgi:glycosyltransferase involved in cell wall biosynthesis